jgi:hypothetical protein
MARSAWTVEDGCATLPSPSDPLLLATVARAEDGWHAWLDQSSPDGPRFPVWTGRTYTDAWRAKLACRCALGWVMRRARSGVGHPLGLFRLTTRRG